MLVANEAEEQIYLQEYFGAPPVSYQAARFYLMMQLARIFYAMAFLSLGSAGEPVDWSEPVPAHSDFQRRFWARGVDLADNHSKTVYGRVHWEQLRHNCGPSDKNTEDRNPLWQKPLNPAVTEIPRAGLRQLRKNQGRPVRNRIW